MKKFYIICALALGMSFTACDEVEEMTGKPQTHPQEAPLTTDDIAVVPAEGLINLVAANEANTPVELATITVANMPDVYTVKLELQVADDEGFKKAFDIPTYMDGDKVMAEADEFDEAFKVYTLDPREKTCSVRYAAYAVSGNSKVRIGGQDFFYGPYTMTVQPFAADFVIEDSYTLELIVNGESSQVPFTHSSASPYDDPNFTAIAQFTDEDLNNGMEWRIVSASGVEYYPEVGNLESGALLEKKEGETLDNGYVMVGAPMKMTVNMKDLTYEYMQAFENIYTPGGSNGWDGPSSQQLYTEDYLNYYGYVVLNGDFKLNPEPFWGGHDMGVQEAATVTVADNGVVTLEGVANGGNNISGATDALYWMTFDYGSREFKAQSIVSLGLIGGFNSWGEQANLTASADKLVWSGTVTLDGGEFKFRANDNWDINLGGSIDDLRYNGDNLKGIEAGTYDVTLNLSALPYTATFVKK